MRLVAVSRMRSVSSSTAGAGSAAGRAGIGETVRPRRMRRPVSAPRAGRTDSASSRCVPVASASAARGLSVAEPVRAP
jgi:hypothetical protein